MRDLTNQHIRAELGARLRHLRLDRNITQAALASTAGVNRKVVSAIERGHETSLDSFITVLRALDLLDRLDDLVPDAVPSPMAELTPQRRKSQRQRARPRSAEQATPWIWGDET